MKKLLVITLSLVSFSSFGAQALSKALELESMQVEFYDASQTGQIRVKGCEQCDKALYKFDKNISVIKNNKPATIQDLLSDQWDAQYPTLFVDFKSLQVIEVAY